MGWNVPSEVLENQSPCSNFFFYFFYSFSVSFHREKSTVQSHLLNTNVNVTGDRQILTYILYILHQCIYVKYYYFYTLSFLFLNASRQTYTILWIYTCLVDIINVHIGVRSFVLPPRFTLTRIYSQCRSKNHFPFRLKIRELHRGGKSSYLFEDFQYSGLETSE